MIYNSLATHTHNSRYKHLLLRYAIGSVERPGLKDPKIGWLDELSRQTHQPYINDSGGPTIKSKYITALYFTFRFVMEIGREGGREGGPPPLTPIST